MSDRDQLAAMIESGIRLEAFPGIIAQHILDSDWLAVHDEAVRAEERERIAVAIEAMKSFAHGKNEISHAHLIGYGTAKRTALRIARAENVRTPDVRSGIDHDDARGSAS